MGGSTKTAKSTNTSEPWAAQKPFLETGFKEAQKLYNTGGPSYYGGDQTANFTPEQMQAFQMTTDRATNGNETMNAAEGYAGDVLAGKYLNSDPYSDQVFQNIQSKVMPSVASQFMGAGRTGSGMHADTATRALTESYAPYASAQYQSGLDRIGQAASMAPMFAANDYADINALQSIGQQQQALNQADIEAEMRKYAYQQDLPYNNLDQYMSSIQGNYGGTSTSAQPYYKPSLFGQIAGGLLGAAGTLGPLLSDARAKQNIRRVGEMYDGTPIHAYQYIGSDVTHFGVIAQEVEMVHPEAVSMRPDGLKAVNYGILADAVLGA